MIKIFFVISKFMTKNIVVSIANISYCILFLVLLLVGISILIDPDAHLLRGYIHRKLVGVLLTTISGSIMVLHLILIIVLCCWFWVCIT
jgi:hypothetical protein